MYEDAEPQLDRILTLVAKCPQSLQEKCFDILLNAYVNSQQQPAKDPTNNGSTASPRLDGQSNPGLPPSAIPEALKNRFAAAAARLQVPLEKLARLFDFQSDPFVYHGLAVPGNGKAEKTRNAALLLAAKTYLATGSWSADWKEFRAMCVDQGCYDRANMQSYLSKESYFKGASAAEGISLSSGGVTAAEVLLAALAAPKE